MLHAATREEPAPRHITAPSRLHEEGPVAVDEEPVRRDSLFESAVGWVAHPSMPKRVSDAKASLAGIGRAR